MGQNVEALVLDCPLQIYIVYALMPTVINNLSVHISIFDSSQSSHLNT